MDPQACLERIVDAWKRKQLRELAEHLASLAVWLQKGGFAPHSGPLVSGHGQNGISMIQYPDVASPRFRIFADPIGGPSYRFIVYSLTSAKKLYEWRIEPQKEQACPASR
jgi:hypothetical protein